LCGRRITCAYLADLMGRRGSGILACLGAVVTLIGAGRYLADVFIGASVSVFWLMLMGATRFLRRRVLFDHRAVHGRGLAGRPLRASGMGLGYGVGILARSSVRVGLALIVGTSNFVKPGATVGAILPAMFFLAFWAALAAVAFLILRIGDQGPLDRGNSTWRSPDRLRQERRPNSEMAGI